jgi:hypothetical protein
MHPVVYNSLKEYDLRQSTQQSENKQDTLSCQNLLYFAVDIFATCFDPYLGHPQAYINT